MHVRGNLVEDQFNSVHFSSIAQSCPALCDPMNHSMPGLPVHHQLPESTQTHVHRVSDAIQPSHPLIRFFSNESTLCMRRPEYWSFSFSIIPSKEIQGLISFRIDWLDLLAVQGTLQLDSFSPTLPVCNCSLVLSAAKADFKSCGEGMEYGRKRRFKETLSMNFIVF